MKITLVLKGGPGSGHFDHEGRPGMVGGSSPDGDTPTLSIQPESMMRHFPSVTKTHIRDMADNLGMEIYISRLSSDRRSGNRTATFAYRKTDDHATTIAVDIRQSGKNKTLIASVFAASGVLDIKSAANAVAKGLSGSGVRRVEYNTGSGVESYSVSAS